MWKNGKCPEVQTVIPISVGDVKKYGATRPVEMFCHTQIGENVVYIVKLWSDVELGCHGLARELYGALLADYFGISTPGVALVEIGPDLAAGQPDLVMQQRISGSLGLNFGSRFIRNSLSFICPLTAAQLPSAAMVFCYDMLLWNMDRRTEKNNLFLGNDGFILYDHEKAFPYSHPIMLLNGVPQPWKFVDEAWPQNHVFYSSLKGEDCALQIEEFITNLDGLSDDILAVIEDRMPQEWSNPDLLNIKEHLVNARGNTSLFKRSLQEVLA